jgi:hypothetical protein
LLERTSQAGQKALSTVQSPLQPCMCLSFAGTIGFYPLSPQSGSVGLFRRCKRGLCALGSLPLPGTGSLQRLCRNLARPIQPVHAWNSSALSALCSYLCSCGTPLVGGGSSGITLQSPLSVTGRGGISSFASSAER